MSGFQLIMGKSSRRALRQGCSAVFAFKRGVPLQHLGVRLAERRGSSKRLCSLFASVGCGRNLACFRLSFLPHWR